MEGFSLEQLGKYLGIAPKRLLQKMNHWGMGLPRKSYTTGRGVMPYAPVSRETAKDILRAYHASRAKFANRGGKLKRGSAP